MPVLNKIKSKQPANTTYTSSNNTNTNKHSYCSSASSASTQIVSGENTKSKTHIINFGIKDISDKDNIKCNNIVLNNFDYNKIDKVEFKIKTYYSNSYVDVITLKNKCLQDFFKDIKIFTKYPYNIIAILPVEDKPSYFYLDINGIQLYSNKNIMQCEMHIHLKKKMYTMDFFKHINFISYKVPSNII